MSTVAYVSTRQTCRACRGTGKLQTHPNLPTDATCMVCQGEGSFLWPMAAAPAGYPPLLPTPSGPATITGVSPVPVHLPLPVKLTIHGSDLQPASGDPDIEVRHGADGPTHLADIVSVMPSEIVVNWGSFGWPLTPGSDWTLTVNNGIADSAAFTFAVV